MKLIFLTFSLAFANLDLANNELCDLNYAACIDGDTSYGADCANNPDHGAGLLCTQECSSHFQNIGGEKYDNYQGFCGLRSFCPPGGCVSVFNIDDIRNYGCWCNFDENLMEGTAHAVNVFDSICRKLQLCLRCAKIDGFNLGNECDPRALSSLGEGSQPFTSDCTESYGGDVCKESVCSCHANFIVQIFMQTWIVGSVYEPEYKHDNGFNRTDTCAIVDNHRNQEVKCCGYLPDRYPYGSDSNRDCCNDFHLYNPVQQICCDDGSVKAAGEIC